MYQFMFALVQTTMLVLNSEEFYFIFFRLTGYLTIPIFNLEFFFLIFCYLLIYIDIQKNVANKYQKLSPQIPNLHILSLNNCPIIDPGCGSLPLKLLGIGGSLRNITQTNFFISDLVWALLF